MRLDKSTDLARCWVFTVVFQLVALDEEASEVVFFIRAVRNRRAPINGLPRDVLALIPQFFDGQEREKIAIVLTHVCRAWREVFISLASLWTHFDCADAAKTRCYFDRSKLAPVSLRLNRPTGFFPNDPFLEVFPQLISRLKRLTVKTTPGYLQDITQHLVHRAPLLEALSIDARYLDTRASSPLTTDLFDGDLASLRELYLISATTQLPWRNMNNLTSISMAYALQPAVSVGQVLDFLESAPRLLTITLIFSASLSTSAAQNGRLVSLARLTRLSICGSQRPSILLDHLIIPVGAGVFTVLDSPGPNIDDHLPKSLENLRNLSQFTKISLSYGSDPYTEWTSIQFTGPNGQVGITSSSHTPDAMSAVPQSLARFDTSKTRCLEVVGFEFTTELRQALLSLTNLRTLIISECRDILPFLFEMDPMSSPDSPIVCPRLKELTVSVYDECDMDGLMEIAAAREWEGVPLKFVKIVSCGEPVPTERVAELLEYVSRVEISTKVDEEED
jgi:hypothetical protein